MVENTYAACIENDPSFKELLGKNTPKQRELITDPKNINIHIEEWATLPEMVKITEDLSKSLLKKSWQFHLSPKNETMLTCDNPVFYSPVIGSNTGPAHSVF